jgi:CubicO group peptidase (beta-lactamase class C family)
MRLSVIFAGFCALVAVAQPKAAEFSAEKLRRVEAAVEAERVRQGVVGLTAAFASRGTTRWVGAFGKADLENDVAVKPATVFRTEAVGRVGADAVGAHWRDSALPGRRTGQHAAL